MLSQTNSELNVIIFGEAGVGKSSLVNVFAGRPVANTSSDADTCTLQAKKYIVALEPGSQIITLWDTAGLSESRLGIEGYLEAVGKADELIQKLHQSGGIHLLLFVMRGARFTKLVERNYKLFSEILCDGKVPTGIVVTHLEHETNPEDWWQRNERALQSFKICYQGHACVTTLAAPANSRQHNEAQQAVTRLIRDCASMKPMKESKEAWVVRVMEWIWRSFVPKSDRPKIRKLTRQLRERCGFSKSDAELIAQRLSRAADDTSST